MPRRWVDLPSVWSTEQRDALRDLLEQTQIDARWEGDSAFTCPPSDAEQVDGLMASLDGTEEALASWEAGAPRERPALPDLPDDPRELAVAGCGLRLAGWFVDSIAFTVIAAALELAGLSAFSHGMVIAVLSAVDAIVLVAWLGGDVGNLAVGTRVVMADDATCVGTWRATIRCLVIVLPPIMAWLVGGGWWFGSIWALVVYSPILFSPLRQGLHDRIAGVLVINHRQVPQRWPVATSFFRSTRR